MAHAVKEMTTIKEREIRPILDRVTGIIRYHLPEQSFRILLFGSWATLTAIPTSDIDVAILGDVPVDPLTMARIREEVEGLPTLRKVDVVDLWIVEERFRQSVMKRAEMLS
jgi:uncharacterized protein